MFFLKDDKNMKIDNVTIKNIDHLQSHIRKKIKSVYVGSRTSTVIPYNILSKMDLGCREICLCDLSAMNRIINIDGDLLEITGPCTIVEIRSYLLSRGYDLPSFPTEELATFLGGIATSATGERSFAYGSLRDHLREIRYIDHLGYDNILGDDELHCRWGNGIGQLQNLSRYQEEYNPYLKFKNGPFPQFKRDKDLLLGTEGQLGVVIGAKIRVVKRQNSSFLLIKIPRWEDDYSIHLEIYEKVQDFRGDILICEFIDSNSFLMTKDLFYKNSDGIILEIVESSFEKIYGELFQRLNIAKDLIFEIPASKFHSLREEIPRKIVEHNEKFKIVKKGTDVQAMDNFADLFSYYRGWTDLGINYSLFGHFGDGHLHFNFLPQNDAEMKKCDKLLDEFYGFVKENSMSPFTEHGIGIIKKEYMNRFYGSTQRVVFNELKNSMDPNRIFFPFGFMTE